MKIDAKEIIKAVEQSQSDKRKVSLYLSGAIYDAFKSGCEAKGVSPSEVAEHLMAEFNRSLGSATSRPKKK